MLSLGPIAFTAPWMLAALATLPILWWLLRITPPAPLVRAFPPLRLLLAVRRQDETPARTPLWLILLRMLIAALVIVALAHPILNPGHALRGSGPLVLVIDDGWASGPRWSSREATMAGLIDRADRDGRPIHVLTTAPRAGGEKPALSNLLRPAEARRLVRAIKPKPWPTDRAAALEAIGGARFDGSAHVAWLSDGLDGPAARKLAARLQQLGSLQMFLDQAPRRASLLGTPHATGDGLSVPVMRADPAGAAELGLSLLGAEGRLLGRATAAFAAGEATATARFALPGEMRNEAARVEIDSQQSAGGAFLLDERWRRRPVGIATGESTLEAQPLLGEDYYLDRALSPFSDVHRGSVGTLLQRELAVMILADIGRLSEAETGQLSQWIDRGGVALRFAGPRLAQTADGLVPVPLRGGGRALGGTMSWTKPAELMPFDENSVFSGLAIPEDVRIRRQVLAEPTLELNDRTWARLSDGTPLVTAQRRGQGWLILIHTTANTEWSNLPISGLFIQMLQRIVGLSQGVVGDDSRSVFPPLESLDGFGVLGPPPAGATAIPGRSFATSKATPLTPPGYYGHGTARRALNLSQGIDRIVALRDLPLGVDTAAYDAEIGFDGKPWLLLAALVLMLADLVISYILRGMTPAAGARNRAAAAAAVAVVAVAALLAGAPAQAQTQEPDNGNALPLSSDPEEAFALRATLDTRLAYVRTGDPDLDAVSEAGLSGLTGILRQRTAIEPAAPMGVNIESDELAFFPLLYWPVSPAQQPLSSQAVEKLNTYLRGGGTILFDTREQADVNFDMFGTGGPAAGRLRMLLSGLDIPALIPVPQDHVMTKSFYLLQDFPGRWAGGNLWVERRGGQHNDGVSSVMIGSNDWAGAWAVDQSRQAMLPVVPGGERQREMAYRVGVNWVMYALTGNYKTDQVHVPAIIERLGQ
jgi:hypothetical protein